jgi:vancomycin resistance protein YoaR
MSRRQLLLFGVPAGLVLVVVLAALVGWAATGRAGADEVLDGVTLTGTDVGGMGRDELTEYVQRRAAAVASTSVVVDTPDGELTIPAADIGLQVDVDATVDETLDTGRDGFAPVAWLRRLFDPAEVTLATTLDKARLMSLVAERDPTGRTAPVEPKVTTNDAGELVVEDGTDGSGLDAGEMQSAILGAASEGPAQVEIDARAQRLAPTFTRADAEELLGQATTLTGTPIDVSAGGTTATIPSDMLRKWLRTEIVADELALAFDSEAVTSGLGELLPDVGQAPVEPSITIQGGRPVIRAGRTGTKCCAPEAAPTLFAALGAPQTAPVAIPLTERAPRLTEDKLQGFAIVEPVGSFTTRYPAGQSRVTNIHRIADIVRGAIIEPGAQFSVNDYVGRRTTQKGFVPGGVIADGVFAEDVGGGVSQFATTMFNTAFFAGLDLVEYQSHSIYISRYPYGREATLSYPKPDLVVRNNSPHGILVWTEYTDTSVTVTLWSTRYATGEQTAQTESPNGACTRVRTERTRHFVNGDTKVDYVFANYRPQEGVAC